MGRRQQQRAGQAGPQKRQGGQGAAQRNLIAVSAEKQELNSVMDLRFGRANYFLIYDPANGNSRFVDNPAKNASGGAGPMAAEMLVNEGVGKIISGDFGPKASDALNAMNIEMVTLQGKEETLESLINKMSH
jgi:predicted Fe-Mo cluster-binding NifX family protein